MFILDFVLVQWRKFMDTMRHASIKSVLANIRGQNMIIIGNVAGTKRINDLNLNINFGEEKVIDESLLNKSQELRDAISKNEITLERNMYYSLHKIQRDRIKNKNIVTKNVDVQHKNLEQSSISENDVKRIVQEVIKDKLTNNDISILAEKISQSIKLQNNNIVVEIEQLKNLIKNLQVNNISDIYNSDIKLDPINHAKIFDHDLKEESKLINDRTMSQKNRTIVKKNNINEKLNKLNEMRGTSE
jgi:hypothetical protein